MPGEPLKVMVLAGGPDRERPVSLASGSQVAAALAERDHLVRLHDIGPENLDALDTFESWGGDVIFPILHGGWGEGGPLQKLLDDRGLPYVGARAEPARLAMQKDRAKLVMQAQGLPTPPFELLKKGRRLRLEPPLVLKPPCEGSSIDTVICRDDAEATRARRRLAARHDELLAERFVEGLEITVSTIEGSGGVVALPAIHIVPATSFYDYEAKYLRDDTDYRFQIDLGADVLEHMGRLAVRTHEVLGCRHLGRVDFIVDGDGTAWILELNTLPGFTTHSLLPKAAARAGLPMPDLVDHLARLGAGLRSPHAIGSKVGAIKRP
jgi:D-alanine-D-alanine ligase